MLETSTERFVTPDGINLVADVGGPAGAPLVVLLHGGGQTRHSWAGAMRTLIGHGYRVINFDARGHGESDWSPTGDYSLKARAEDLQTVLAGHSEPVALVGASMGGMTSFYAIGNGMLPQARALVMVDIVLRPAAIGVTKIQKFMQGHVDGFATLDEVADAVAAYNPQRPRPADTSGLLKNVRQREDGRLYWHWDPKMMEINHNPDIPNWTAQLLEISGNIKIPTMLIRGGKSDIVDDAGVEEMCRLVPGTEVHEVAEAGHMVAGDKNDQFNSGMMDFLTRNLPISR